MTPPESGAGTGLRRGSVRFGIVAMLFAVTAVNYADRATLSLAGPSVAKALGLNAVALGWAFSAFAWTYLVAQIPSGWVLDRFGVRLVYFASLLAWSIFTLLQGTVIWMGAAAAAVMLFVFRALVGAAEAPSYPGNARIVASWFPAAERGTATAIFNSAQYFATALFAPVMGAVITLWGWPHVFSVMGGLGILLALLWLRVIHEPRRHPRLSQAELDYIAAGGALVDADAGPAPSATPAGRPLRHLLHSRSFLAHVPGSISSPY